MGLSRMNLESSCGNENLTRNQGNYWKMNCHNFVSSGGRPARVYERLEETTLLA